jgi:mannose-6-phosphate isomerase
MAPTPLHPLLLPLNQIDHLYQGGDRITELRGGPGGAMRPEEWLGATVPRHGETRSGLASLRDGSLLRDVVLADPLGWLGQAHHQRFGANPALLVKLLDAGERLPVHVHPTRRFARDHLDCDYGKTEAWVILSTPPAGGDVWVGCQRDVTEAELRGLVERQDKQGLVSLLHHMTVEPGDAVLVPSGTPHCTGAGVFLMELQEPTDFSILLEWEGFAFDGPNDGHLGIGFDQALRSVNRRAFTTAQVGELRKRNGQPIPSNASVSLLPDDSALLPASFAIVLVVAGHGQLQTGDYRTDAPRGSAFAVPHGAGPMRFTGSIDALVALSADPDSAPPIEFDRH